MRATVPSVRSPSTTAQPSSSCAHHSPSSSAGAAAAGDRQLLPAQGLGARAVLDALQAHDRPRVGAGAPHDLMRALPPTVHLGAAAQQTRAGPSHVEAAVEAVRAPDPARRQPAAAGASAVALPAAFAQSTMSTST